MILASQSYACVRAVTVAGGSSIRDQLAALEAATSGTLPKNWSSSMLAIMSEGALVLTDPVTSVAFTLTAGSLVPGDFSGWTPGAGDVLLFFGAVPGGVTIL